MISKSDSKSSPDVVLSQSLIVWFGDVVLWYLADKFKVRIVSATESTRARRLQQAFVLTFGKDVRGSVRAALAAFFRVCWEGVISEERPRLLGLLMLVSP